MTDAITDKEHELNNQLRHLNEQQEENHTSRRKLEESEHFIQEAYLLEQHFLNDLSDVLHTSDSLHFLQSIEEEHRDCKRQSLIHLEKQLEELQQEKQILTEKEHALLDERTALFQEEAVADEH